MENHLTNRTFRFSLLIMLLLLSSTVGSLCQAQTPEIKSLLEKLRSLPNDTNKVLLLVDVGNKLRSTLPNSSDSLLAYYEKTRALGKKLHSDGSIVQRMKSALPYFEQGITLGKKLHYDSGIIKSMTGIANMWIDLSQLKQEAELSDSIERLQIERQFNAIIAYVKQKKFDSQTAAVYYKLAGRLASATEYYDWVRVLYDSAVVYYHKAKDTKMESWALARTAFYSEEHAQPTLKLYYKSIDLAEAAGHDPPAFACSELGMDLALNGDYKSGLSFLQRAYRISARDSASSDPEAIESFAMTCIYLGNTYEGLNDLPLALKYHYRAIHILERHVQMFPEDLLGVVANIVAILTTVNRSEEALDLLLRIQKSYPSLKLAANHFTMAAGLMRVYLKLGKTALAQKYCDTLITFTSSPDPVILHLAQSYGYFSVTNFFIKTKQYDKAKKYALLYATTIKGQKEYISNNYYMLYQIDSAQGNLKSALAYYREHKLLSDSLINESRVKEIERLNIEFDTKNREQRLALVSKDAEITRQQLYEAGVKTNIIIGGLVLAVIVLMLIYHLYRVKKKAGDLLQVQRDEIVFKNLALEKAIQENEWLLKEVHHRVKNNLHMISGLLMMQANDLKEGTAKTAIMNSQNRVQAMSMVHQKLSSDNRISVDLSSYLKDLIDHLKESYDTRRIYFKVSIEPIIVDARTAISLGLIVNEAITNSIKYAFPRGRMGNVLISLHHTPEALWKLVIQDDGVGISQDTVTRPKSVGMTLIEGISEELDGDLRIDSSYGFLVEITFPYAEKGIPAIFA